MERIRGPVALAFPGAFVQPAGPEEAFREAHRSVFDRVMEEASQVVGTDLARVAVEDASGLEEGARQVFLQAFGIAVAEAVRQAGVTVAGTLGHSLGAYAAVVAAGALPVASGLMLVREAWRLVREAYESDPLGMLGIVGLGEQEVLSLPGMDRAQVVLVNGPWSLVVAGTPETLEVLQARAMEAGALKAVQWTDRVAYHHPGRLSRAADRLAGIAVREPWRDPDVPVCSAVDGSVARTAAEALTMIRANLCSPVRWPLAVEAASGASGFVECGIGTSLVALARMLPDSRPWWGARHWRDLP